MTTTIATRRLAAILAADVVGYSRLMGADEEGTHERLKAHLREVVDPKIREHHGRIVKTTGDGVLAEFASVVDAVRCAAEIQRAMADRDLDLAEERRLRFRIGVNLGLAALLSPPRSLSPGSHVTLSWRKADSNRRSLSRTRRSLPRNRKLPQRPCSGASRFRLP